MYVLIPVKTITTKDAAIASSFCIYLIFVSPNIIYARKRSISEEVEFPPPKVPEAAVYAAFSALKCRVNTGKKN